MSNKAVVLQAFNAADPASAVGLENQPRPTPGPGQVLVRITLRPVNPADIFSLMGVYPGFRPEAFPTVPGLEGVGVVEENGAEASKFAVGQRVVGCPFDSVDGGSGTWQQYMVVSEACLLAVPDAVNDEAAAQAWINPATVYGMLVGVLAVPEGEWVLQTAAGSVLGRQVIQLAKARGVKTINVVRRAEQAEELKQLGADEVVVSVAGEGLVEAVQALTGGRMAHSAIECVGGELFAQVVAAVRPGGTALLYGAMSGLTATFSIPDVLFRGVDIKGFWLIPHFASLPAAERQRVLGEVMALLADGTITPLSGERYPLERAAEAVAKSMSAARGGKVLLEG